MTPALAPPCPERPLTATRLAQYATVRGRCERYLRLRCSRPKALR